VIAPEVTDTIDAYHLGDLGARSETTGKVPVPAAEVENASVRLWVHERRVRFDVCAFGRVGAIIPFPSRPTDDRPIDSTNERR
jgi:hypothetical protein